jgi:ubiquinone/menaquinone biosynthesis C-methylase UbiE
VKKGTNEIKNYKMESWKTENLAETYLDGVRSAIPLANEQIEILLRLIKRFRPNVESFLDLGCGDGVLGKTLYTNWTESKGIFVDYSEPMINAAKIKCKEYENQSVFVVQDFGKADWLNSISTKLPVDVVISGFSIHHQNDDNKKRIYTEIFEKILKPGGIFLNLEQVKSATPEIETIFNEFFMDRMRQFQQETNSNIPIETIEEEFYKDKKVNILASVEQQCEWLRELGFTNVDCFFKIFELSIFGGIKPK